MMLDPIHVKFQNKQNPRAEFDLLDLKIFSGPISLDHSPYELHLVEFYIMIFIEEGEGSHTIDFHDYNYKKGSILTVRKDQIHKFHKINSNVKGTMLLFTDDFLVTYLEKLEVLKTLQLFNEVLGVPKIQLSEIERREIVRLVDRMKAEYFKVNDDYSMSIIRSELHILIAKLYRIKSSRNPLIVNRKYLSEFIQLQNLVEQKAALYRKVQDYAKLMGVSTKTLNTITKTIVNKPAKEFINDICIKQIKRLLINTELSVKEVAYTSGFEESTNFYKYFKQQTNLTPEQFRATFH